jgi:hypothetical protein
LRNTDNCRKGDHAFVSGLCQRIRDINFLSLVPGEEAQNECQQFAAGLLTGQCNGLSQHGTVTRVAVQFWQGGADSEKEKAPGNPGAY